MKRGSRFGRIARPLAAAFLSLWTARAAPAGAADVLTGIDILEGTNFRELQGKRIGLITNQTGVDRRGKSDVEILGAAPGVILSAVFSPEHGFAGTVEDGKVSSGTVALEGGRVIPLYSLYGSTLAPTTEMLAGLDALVFDIQDVGARFYTYAATMGMALESAAAAHIDFFVLDRPDPVTGRILEGPVLAPDIRHLTAYFPVPIRHGLTIGEIARVHVLLDKVNANLTVIPMKGWKRDLWFDETGLPWVRPSPNMPDLQSATLYPGIACFEATNLSVGRGTPRPFLWIGAPWLDAKRLLRRLRHAKLYGMSFSVKSYVPAKSVYEGQKCGGLAIRIKDRDRIRPLRIFAQLATALRDQHPKDFEVRWDEMRRMVGTDRFRELYEAGAGPDKLIELFDQGSAEFEKDRGLFLLY